MSCRDFPCAASGLVFSSAFGVGPDFEGAVVSGTTSFRSDPIGGCDLLVFEPLVVEPATVTELVFGERLPLLFSGTCVGALFSGATESGVVGAELLVSVSCFED